MSIEKKALFDLDLGEGFSKTLSKIMWNPESGPFENIFRWADRILILSGGGKAIIMGILYFFGIGLHDLGRMIDESENLSNISDLANINADSVGKNMAEMLWQNVEMDKESYFVEDGILVFAAHTAEQKLKMIDEFEKSGKSLKGFAKDKGIPESTFRGWIRQKAAGRLKKGPARTKLKMSPVTKKKGPAKKKAPTKKPAPAAPTKKPSDKASLTPFQREKLKVDKEKVKLTKEKIKADERKARQEKDFKEKVEKQRAFEADQDRKARERIKQIEEAEKTKREVSRDQSRTESERIKERQRSQTDQAKERERERGRQQSEREKRQYDEEKRQRESEERQRKEKSEQTERKRREKVESKKFKQQQKNMLKVEKMRGNRPSVRGLRRIGGKAGLITALIALIGGTTKLVANPNSWLGKPLRAAGIIGAETVQNAPTRTRERAAPPPTTTRPDDGLNQAERIIEEIFSN